MRSAQTSPRLFFAMLALAFSSAVSAVQPPCARAQSRPAGGSLVLNGVSVVDTRTGKVTPNRSVVIVEGKIVRIEAALPAGKRSAGTIDARGKFVVPGFWDMHAHPLDTNRAQTLAVMLAYGITGVRQMSGSDENLQQRKDGTLYPTPDSPEIVAMPGVLITRMSAATPEAAVALIDHEKAAGADFIKSVDATPPTFFAALAESNKQGMRFVGHLSPGVDPAKASMGGMRAIEHLGPGETILNSCSTDADAIEAAVAKRPPPTPQNMPPDLAMVMARLGVANPTLSRAMADPTYFTRLKHVIDTYSTERCGELAKVFVAHGTWQVVTLIRERTMQMGDDPLYTRDPNLKYVSPATMKTWNLAAQLFTEHVPAEGKEVLKNLNALQLRQVKEFDGAGVKMLAGSDFGGVWVIPGVSLHQEFDLLAQAGLSPLRVLQMTTLDGAEFLGRTGSDGTVEAGRNANLVVLDGDPMQSVNNLHKVYAVVRDGRLYSAAALEGLKSKAAAELAAMPEPRGPGAPASKPAP